MDLDLFTEADLRLEELSVTSMRDSTALPETGASSISPIPGSSGLSCSCCVEIE